MRVLLKEGADAATSDSILVPRLGGGTLETLVGEAVDKGILAEVDAKTVRSALNAGARSRDDSISAKDLKKEVDWVHKALGEYESGSLIGLKPTPRGFKLDDSEAKRIDRAKGLAKDDTIAIGPLIKPRWFLNARGRVVSIKGKHVVVELDPGDHDRVERASGKEVGRCPAVPRACVEKVS